MGLIFALSAQSQLPELLGPGRTAVAGQFLVYASLAALFWWGLAHRGPTAGWAFALAFVPGRSPSLSDLGVDASGALCTLTFLGFWGVSGHKTPTGKVTPRQACPPRRRSFP
jgi:hypothetical protein